MIISAGYNIAGPEVEGALLAHPAVAECGVVGAAGRGTRHGGEGLCRFEARELSADDEMKKQSAGARQAQHRALQVPARNRVRGRAAAHRDRKAAALQAANGRKVNTMKILQPPGWAKPRGYSNGIAVTGGTTVFVAGQIAFNSENVIRGKDIRRAIPPDPEEHPGRARRSRRQARAHRAHDLVHHRQEGVPRRDQGGRRGVPRADRPALPGDGGGAGGRADGRRGESRDRDHGGRAG